MALEQHHIVKPQDHDDVATWFDYLLRLMMILRGPQGCPWVQQQTHVSLMPYLHEEAYEVDEAILKQDHLHLQEELGDILLQVIFHAAIGQEQDHFSIREVLIALSQKLIRRHPHVFNPEYQTQDLTIIAKRWEEIKQKEQSSQPNPSLRWQEALPPFFQLERLVRQWHRLALPSHWLLQVMEQSLPVAYQAWAKILLTQTMQGVKSQHAFDQWIRKLATITDRCQHILQESQGTWDGASEQVRQQCQETLEKELVIDPTLAKGKDLEENRD